MPDLIDALREDFDAATLTRGVGYYRQGRVGRYRLEDGVLTAHVRGSERYEISVDLVNLDLGPKRIHLDFITSDCTCPVGIQCEHAVAAVLAWSAGLGQDLSRALTDRREEVMGLLSRPVAKPPPPPPRFDVGPLHDKPWKESLGPSQWWLSEVRSLGFTSPDPEHTLLYVVHYQLLSKAVLVEVVASRRLKSGRRGVLKRYPQPQSLLQNQPPFVLAEDRSLIAELLYGMNVRPYGQMTDSNVLSSGLLLDRLIASGRAVWGAVDGPVLTAGPMLQTAWHWAIQQGRMRLELADPSGKEIQVLPTQPLRYIANHTVGPLQAGSGDDAIAALAMRMPWLHPVEAGLAAPALAAHGIDLPPPYAVAPAIPACELHIRSAMVGWQNRKGDGRRKSAVACVVFRYGEGANAIRTGEHGPAILENAGEPLLRNEIIERNRREELDRHGLAVWVSNAKEGRTISLSTDEVVRVPRDVVDAAPEEEVVLAPAVLAALQASGWTILGTEIATVRMLELDQVALEVSANDDGDWFEIAAGISVDGERIDLVPLLTPLLKGGPAAWSRIPQAVGDPPAVLVTVGPDRVLRVGLDLLTTLHDQLIELFDRPVGPGGGWTLDAARADLVSAFEHLSPRWIGGERLLALAERLRTCLEPPAVDIPDTLHAVLRDYQRQGVAWMQQLQRLGLGGILADDMGLGKTVQAIAHLLLSPRAPNEAHLVVCPASMVGVWLEELTRFAPSLLVEVVHGSGRKAAATANAAVVITSHATLARGIDDFSARPWQVVICDEAQALKNRSTRLAAAIRKLEAQQRICLTGTPVENHLGELHALMSWAVPGVLGSEAAFTRTFRDPIENEGDAARGQLLRRRLAPFLLRRTKQAVAAELPPRTDIDIRVELGDQQRRLYETIRLAMDERVRQAVAERGLARSGMEVIEALLRLRQVCCDPRLVPLTLAKRCDESAKLDALRELLTTLIEEGRPTLVFSQFTSLLDLVESEVLKNLGVSYLRLDGQTRDRSDLVTRFQAGEAQVFLLSLKAGGTGLTLTRADTVILLDPWWNPAVERQAADRAHRIGQDRPVTVYRLVAVGTVEERIRALQARKSALADALVGEDGQALGRLTVEDIDALLAPLPQE